MLLTVVRFLLICLYKYCHLENFFFGKRRLFCITMYLIGKCGLVLRGWLSERYWGLTIFN